jgi:hypothetical protein
MTTLALDSIRPFELGDRNEFPMIAADIIYEGAAGGLVDASGHARPLTSVDKFIGFAAAKADNSLGAAAAINVRMIKKGCVQLSVSGAVITDVGQPVYATDDDTFVFLPTGGVFIGFVRRFVSSGVVIVEFDAGVFKDPNEGFTAETVADNLTLDAQDSGKLLVVTVDAKAITLPAVEGMSNIRIMNGGAFGAVAVTVSPNANDMVENVNVAGVDDKDIVNTKATARRGDYIDLDYSDANGWVVTRTVGTWAKQA